MALPEVLRNLSGFKISVRPGISDSNDNDAKVRGSKAEDAYLIAGSRNNGAKVKKFHSQRHDSINHQSIISAGYDI